MDGETDERRRRQRAVRFARRTLPPFYAPHRWRGVRGVLSSYSALRVSIGSIAAARRAGRYVASAPVARMTPIAVT